MCHIDHTWAIYIDKQKSSKPCQLRWPSVTSILTSAKKTFNMLQNMTNPHYKTKMKFPSQTITLQPNKTCQTAFSTIMTLTFDLVMPKLNLTCLIESKKMLQSFVRKKWKLSTVPDMRVYRRCACTGDRRVAEMRVYRRCGCNGLAPTAAETHVFSKKTFDMTKTMTMHHIDHTWAIYIAKQKSSKTMSTSMTQCGVNFDVSQKNVQYVVEYDQSSLQTKNEVSKS